MKTIETKLKEFSKDKLITEVASRLNLYKESVDEVYSCFEAYILELLMMAGEDYDVSIRVFNGICLQSIYEREKKKISNITKKEVTVKPKLKFKAFFTPYFKNEKVKEFRDNKEQVSEWYSARQR